MQNQVEEETVILARPRNSNEWSVINRVRGDRHKQDAEKLLTKWAAHAVDRNGHFYGWDFKIKPVSNQ